jgi:hypothetical protein
MIMRCAVTEAAARLTLQLEAYPIPDDFDPSGKYWQVITRVRNRYTNYQALVDALPDCPLNCGRRVGAGCSSYDFATDILDQEARRLAVCSLDAWQARRKTLPVENKTHLVTVTA